MMGTLIPLLLLVNYAIMYWELEIVISIQEICCLVQVMGFITGKYYVWVGFYYQRQYVWMGFITDKHCVRVGFITDQHFVRGF